MSPAKQTPTFLPVSIVSIVPLVSIVMALAGGLLTIVLGAWHVMRRKRDKLAVPYGVAISIGGLWVLAIHYLPAAEVAGVSG